MTPQTPHDAHLRRRRQRNRRGREAFGTLICAGFFTGLALAAGCAPLIAGSCGLVGFLLARVTYRAERRASAPKAP